MSPVTNLFNISIEIKFIHLTPANEIKVNVAMKIHSSKEMLSLKNTSSSIYIVGTDLIILPNIYNDSNVKINLNDLETKIQKEIKVLYLNIDLKP